MMVRTGIQVEDLWAEAVGNLQGTGYITKEANKAVTGMYWSTKSDQATLEEAPKP